MKIIIIILLCIGLSIVYVLIQGYNGEQLTSALEFKKQTDCVFECPPGTTLKPKEYIRIPDGCGPTWFPMGPFQDLYGLRECCYEHDICYGTCGKTKKECDDKFLENIKKKCDQFTDPQIRQRCYFQMQGLYHTTTTLGCTSYLQDQARA